MRQHRTRLFGLQDYLLTPFWELVSCRRGAGIMHLAVSENGNKAWGVPVLVLSFDVQITGISGLLQPVGRCWPEVLALFVSLKNCFSGLLRNNIAFM